MSAQPNTQQNQALFGLDDACHTVLPLLSQQIEVAKQKTESEVSRLVGAFAALKKQLDSLSARANSASREAESGASTPEMTETGVGEKMRAIPAALSELLRNANDIAYLGDKICFLGADLYQRAARKAGEEGSSRGDPDITAISMKLVVASFEVLDFAKSMQDKLRDLTSGVPDLMKIMMATIHAQRETIEALRSGNPEPKGIDGADALALQEINSSIDFILEGFQFQDQVSQTLDAVTNSMRDFLENVPALGGDASQSMHVDIEALLNKIKSRSVTRDQLRVMGVREGGMKPGDSTLF